MAYHKIHDTGKGKLRNRNTRVVAYCRVSTGNSDQKQSFQAQQDYYLHKFKEQGYTVAPTGLLHKLKGGDEFIEGIYADEGISGTSTKKRVAFLQMIEDAKKGLFDVIFVKSVSRFARNTVDGLRYCEELRAVGVAVMFEDYNVCSISEDKDFELSLFFSLAQKESQTKSYNVKWGIRRSQQAGTWVTQASFGYNKVGRDLEINEAEAEVVKEIFKIYIEEGWGFAKIASYLQNKGVPTKRNAKWNMRRINEILSNPIYKGVLRVHTIENRTIKDHSDKIMIPEDEHIVSIREDLRLVSDDVWEKANEQKSHRSAQMGAGSKPSRKYKYSSFLYCWGCGGAFRAKNIWRHQQTPLKYEKENIPKEYCCNTRDTYRRSVICPTQRRVSIRESRIDEIMAEQITKMKQDKSYLDNLFYVYEVVTRGFPKTEEEKAELYRRREDINTEIRLVLRRAMDKDTSVYDEILDELEKELEEINTEISKEETRQVAVQLDYDKYQKYLAKVDSIDPNNFTRVELQELFTRVEVLQLEQAIEGWNKGVATGLIFEYKFIDMPQMELVNRACAMGIPSLEMAEIVIV